MLSARQLEAFKAVMETGSISRAAQSLNLSQPAVSKLILGLEERVGFGLFLRERQRLIPTAEAAIFLAEVENLFGGFTRLEQLADDLKRLTTGNLAIAAMPSAGISLLPRIIAGFQADRSAAFVGLRIRSSIKVAEMAVAQAFDVGLGLLPVDHPSVQCETLLRARAVVVLPRHHALAGERVVRAEQLRGEAFISLGDDDRSRHLIDEVFDQAGVHRKVVAKTSLSLAAAEFVRCGAGVAVIDPITAFSSVAPELVCLPLEPALFFDFRLLLPQERRPSHLRSAFVAYLRAHFADFLPACAMSADL